MSGRRANYAAVMSCPDFASAPSAVSSIADEIVTAAIALAVLYTIYWIRKRWAAREAAGSVAIATWWEAIVHALAVSTVIVVGLAFAAGFAFRAA